MLTHQDARIREHIPPPIFLEHIFSAIFVQILRLRLRRDLSGGEGGEREGGFEARGIVQIFSRKAKIAVLKNLIYGEKYLPQTARMSIFTWKVCSRWTLGRVDSAAAAAPRLRRKIIGLLLRGEAMLDWRKFYQATAIHCYTTLLYYISLRTWLWNYYRNQNNNKSYHLTTTPPPTLRSSLPVSVMSIEAARVSQLASRLSLSKGWLLMMMMMVMMMMMIMMMVTMMMIMMIMMPKRS